MDKADLQKLFEGVDQALLDSNLLEKINSLVEARVSALTKEIEEKEHILVQEAQNLKKQTQEILEATDKEYQEKEKILKEEAEAFVEKSLKSLAEKEAIMIEEVGHYVEHAEKVIAEEAEQYRSGLVGIVSDEAKLYKEYVENIVLEEAKNHKQMQDAGLAQEVGKFKGELVEKLSQYLESQLTQAIPQTIMESAVKLSAYEPLVEGIMGVFGEKYIKLDTTNYEVIKKAKADNEKLTESLNIKAKEAVNFSGEVRELKKQLKVLQLTEGLLPEQKQKAIKLLEGCTADDVETKFAQIKDIIIESSVRKPQQVVSPGVPAKKVVHSELAQKKLEKIQEQTNSNLSPEMAGWTAKLKRI